MDRKAKTRIVFGFGFFALFLFFGNAHAATLYFSPNAKNVSVGQTFTVNVEVGSPDQAMNAASGDVSFPANKLRVVSLSRANSIMDLWVRNPSFTNSISGGDVNFEGVVLNPGFTGASGNVLSIIFQAIAPGSAQLSFSAGSVLANDGNGTNILDGMQTAAITIAAAPPSSPQASAVPTPAGNFTIAELPSSDPTDPQPIFTWNAAGVMPDVSGYLVKIGSGDLFDASTITAGNNDYKLPIQAPGEAISLTVLAYDSAGNTAQAIASFNVAPLPAPQISNYSDYIQYFPQMFSADGSASGTNVNLYLERPGDRTAVKFATSIDQNGNWSFAGGVKVPTGLWNQLWTLRAQSSDSRGALSAHSSAVPVSVEGLIPFLLTWLGVLLLILLILWAIVKLVRYIKRKLQSDHSGRPAGRVRQEIQSDLKRIEKELDADQPNQKVDLSPSALRKKQERIRKEIEHLEEDIKRENDE